jgi:peptidoglycan/xylan/chitin deacetylase (PgdA/CDA1 family)
VVIRRVAFLALLVVPAAVFTVESWWWNQRVEATVRLLADPDPRVVYAAGGSPDRKIALTIDDGPDARTTPAILDVLRRYGARATFFLIAGRVAGNEATVQRIVAEGHELGNHMIADRPSIDLAPGQFERCLEQAHDILSRWQSPAWFRPASGWYDEDMIETVEDHGYRMALGRIYPLDAVVDSPGLAERYILWQAEPGEIIILHDGGARGRNTVRILERVLPVLKERGLEVVGLSGLRNPGGSAGRGRKGPGSMKFSGHSDGPIHGTVNSREQDHAYEQGNCSDGTGVAGGRLRHHGARARSRGGGLEGGRARDGAGHGQPDSAVGGPRQGRQRRDNLSVVRGGPRRAVEYRRHVGG